MKTLARSLLVGVVATGLLVSCGSSDSRDRNAGVTLPCAQGGPCDVGDPGPAGGIVIQGGDAAGDEVWETAPVNGHGTFDEAVEAVGAFVFGGYDDWVLPSSTIIDAMYDNADVFACTAGTDCVTAYAAATYWTGEAIEDGANAKSFVDGGKTADFTTSRYYFRPVRSFRIGDALTPTTTAPVEEPTTTVEVTTTTVGVDEPTTTVEEATTTTALVEEPTTTVEATTTTVGADEPTTTVEEATTTTAPVEATTTVPETPVKPATCADGGPCDVGDVGPAGGIVLRADFMLGQPATLIEVAPTTWYGNAVKAKSFAENLTFGGFDDWRVPDLSQLLSMRRERARFACAAGTRCTSGFNSSTYWGAEEGMPARTVSFAGTGDPQFADPTTAHFVRPIRLVAVLEGNADVILQEPEPS